MRPGGTDALVSMADKVHAARGPRPDPGRLRRSGAGDPGRSQGRPRRARPERRRPPASRACPRATCSSRQGLFVAFAERPEAAHRPTLHRAMVASQGRPGPALRPGRAVLPARAMPPGSRDVLRWQPPCMPTPSSSPKGAGGGAPGRFDPARSSSPPICTTGALTRPRSRRRTSLEVVPRGGVVRACRSDRSTWHSTRPPSASGDRELYQLDPRGRAARLRAWQMRYRWPGPRRPARRAPHRPVDASRPGRDLVAPRPAGPS